MGLRVIEAEAEKLIAEFESSVDVPPDWLTKCYARWPAEYTDYSRDAKRTFANAFRSSPR